MMIKNKKTIAIGLMFFCTWCASAEFNEKKPNYGFLEFDESEESKESKGKDNKGNKRTIKDLYHSSDEEGFFELLPAPQGNALNFLRQDLSKLKTFITPQSCLETYKNNNGLINLEKGFKELEDRLKRLYENYSQTHLDKSNSKKDRYNNNLSYIDSALSKNGYFNGGLIDQDIFSNLANIKMQQSFIVTQAPIKKDAFERSQMEHVEDTTTDFYQKLWDYNTPVVVNLTDFYEMRPQGRLHKSEQYWPVDKSVEPHGDIAVKTVDLLYSGNIEVYALQLKKEGHPERIVYLLHYKKWPDNGCAPLTDDVIHLKDIVDACSLQAEADTKKRGAIVVHCSAGQRRTGFYTFFHLVVDHIEATNTMPDLVEIIFQMNFIRWQLGGDISFWRSLFPLIDGYFQSKSNKKSEN